jgi:hypothetical protein
VAGVAVRFERWKERLHMLLQAGNGDAPAWLAHGFHSEPPQHALVHEFDRTGHDVSLLLVGAEFKF